MKPLPWSSTALDDFKNCPRSYHAKYVLKAYKDAPKGAEALWGIEVHKHFEDRVAVGKPLPADLIDHEPYLAGLVDAPGVLFTEQKMALNKRFEPTHFFERDVFCRAITDVTIVNDAHAQVVDYKTGKPHTKQRQLMLNAIHVFALHPNVLVVDSEFYWTSSKTSTSFTYTRDQIPELWDVFLPDLWQYKHAFNGDVWQPRPSGLCNGWCPNTECEHWKPKRQK